MIAVSSRPQTRCKACDHPRQNNGGYASVRTSMAAMDGRSKQGCVPCSILSRAIKQFSIDNNGVAKTTDQDEQNEDWQFRLDFNMQGIQKSLEVALLGTDIVLALFNSQVTSSLSRTLPDLPVGYEVPSHTSSSESLAWAVQQIQHCQESHSTCKAASTNLPLPKRVLDVGNSADSQPYIRLYESGGECGKSYICLSHCWGQRPFLRTLSGSLNSHKKSIVWDHLPQTFQDAIEYTRKLGVRYLWIDSLCIIQDDEEDWRHEAAKMASIYEGSFLVLSAAKSPNAYGGLFAEFPAKHRTHTVEIPIPEHGRQEEIHVRQSLAHSNTRLLIQPLYSNKETLPTLTRGWIFQERFLAPRILHFGSEELSWECLECSACQCTPSPPPASASTTVNTGIPTWYQYMLNRTSRPKSYYNPFVWAEMTPGELATCWLRMVTDYTRLHLTYERDIFPGISGLARQMQRASGSQDGNKRKGAYVAGLWRDSLWRDLLWHVSGDVSSDGGSAVRPGRPRKWRAPSWSWAAVKAPVEFLDQTEGMDVRCELVGEVECVAAGPDPMGELVHVAGKNELCVKGVVVPALMRLNKKPGRESSAQQDGMKSWEVVELDIFDGHMKNVWVDDGCDWLWAAPGVTTVSVYCLFVGVKTTKALCFLVLREVLRQVDTDGEVYERIAVAEVFGGPAGPGSWVERLLSAGCEAVVPIR